MSLARFFTELKRCSRAEWMIAVAILCSTPTLMHILSPKVLHAQVNGTTNTFYYTDPGTIPAGSPGATIYVYGYFPNGPIPVCFYTGYGSKTPITPSADAGSYYEIITIPASTIQQIPASSFSGGSFNASVYGVTSTSVACNGSYNGSFTNAVNTAIVFPTLSSDSLSALPQPNPNLGPVTRPSIIDFTGTNFSSAAVVKYSGYPAPTSGYISATSVRATIPATGTATSITATVCNEGPVEYCSGSLTIPVAPLSSQTGILTASPSPTTPSTSTSLTATFTGTAGIPSGTATFKDGTSTIGTAALAFASGHFVTSTGTNLAAMTENSHAVVADFNKDGIPDVLLYTSHTLDIFLANSIRGTFAADAQMYLDSSYCGTLLGVTTADFNEDGYNDLALLCTRQGSDTVKYVVIFHNNGNGTFTQDYNPALLPQTVSVHPNLSGPPPPPIAVHPNITFQANQSATLITSADINKDGHIDIVLAGPDGNGNMAIQTYPGKGTGDFDTSKPEIIAPAAYGSQIAAVDLNNDGYPDLVILNDDGDPATNDVKNIVVFQNDKTGSFPTTPTYQRAPGDGVSNTQFFIQKLPTSNYPNIVVINTGTTQQITNLLNNGTATIGFAATAYTDNVTGLVSASMGDFNGDGYPDLAVYSTPDGGSTYKLEVYPATHTASGQYSTPASSFTFNATGTIRRLLDNTSDADGDGFSDPLFLVPTGAEPDALAQFLTSGTSTAALPATTFASGSHNLTATNPGTTTYAAGTASTTLQSNGPSDTLTLSTGRTSPVTYSTSTDTLTATVTFAATSPTASGTVTFRNATTNTVLGTVTLKPIATTFSAATVTFGPLAVGTYSLTASYSGDSNYSAANFPPVTYVVNKATPVLSYAPTPTTIASGTRLVASQLNATVSGGIAGTFTYTNAANQPVDTNTILPAGNNVITATFTPTDTTDYVSGGTTTGTIKVLSVGSVSLSVNPASPTTYSSTGTETLFATVNSAAGTPTGTVQFYDGGQALGTPRTLTSSSGTGTASLVVGPLAPGTHTLSVTYSGDANTTSATSTNTSYVVNQTTPTVNYTLAQPTITYGTAVGASNLAATATSGGVNVPGSFTYTDAANNPVTAATIFGAGVRTITATFTPTDTNTYSTAGKTVTLTVNKATPVITFAPNPATITYPTPLSAAQLDATVSGNLPGNFSYFASSTSASLIVNVGTVLGVGTYNLTANFTPTDTANYNSAAPVSSTLTVTRATPTVTYTPTPATIPSGTGLVASQLNASSTGGGSGTFTYTNAANQPVTVGTVLPVGTNVITATFTPSDTTDYNPATATGTITVAGTASVFLSVTPTSPTTYSTTGTETLFATVSSSTSPSPTGSVQFFDGSTSLGTRALTVSSGGGTASLVVGPLLPGTHALTVAYLGDANYATITSAPSSYVVNQTTPTITYAPVPATIAYGTALVASQLNATATTGTGTVIPGTFAYTLGGTPVTTATVLPAGSNVITATFTPTDNVTYTTATKTATIIVGKATPVLTYTPVPTTITYGTALVAGQLNATSTVPGTFAYTLGATPVNTSTVLPAGANVITATFTPTDTNSYAVTTKTATINVTAAAPSVTYNPSPASIVLGTPIVASQLNAIAQFNAATVPGTFAYTANGSPVVIGTLLPVGANTITALFTPTDTATYSTASRTATINVTQAAPSVSLFVNPASPTTYTATGTETLNATVSSPTSPAPTGTVQFYDGTTLLGTRTLAPSSGGSTASLTVGPLLPGTHVLTVVYSGDSSYTTLTSAPGNYVVNPGTPTLTYTPVPATITYGTALVAGQLNAIATFNSVAVPGTFTYRLGSTPLAVGSTLPFGANTITATFTPNDLTTYTTATRTAVINVTQGTPVITYNPVPNSIVYGTGVVAGELNAVATIGGISVPGTFQYIRGEQNIVIGTILPVGTNSITAYFTPTDTSAVSSAFGSGIINVTQGTANVNLSITPGSPTTYSASGTETLSAIVTSGNSPTPTGSVQFFDGPTPLGTVSLTVSGLNSTASLTVGPLSAGTHVLTVAYLGDATYATVTSLPTTYTVNKATPTLTYTPTPAAITFGTGLLTTQLNATASVPGTFVYTLGTTPVAVGTRLPAGTNTITATFTPTDALNYLGATRTAVINVGQAGPVITYSPTPAGITYGTGLVASQLNATATFAGNTIPGTFAYTLNGSPVTVGTILPAGANVIRATFTPTDALTYTVAVATATINVGSAAPTIIWTPPAPITAGTPLSATQLNARATGIGGVTLPGTFTYTPAAGTILAPGATTLSATFIPTDTVDYNTTSISVPLNVDLAAPTVTVTSSANPAQFGQPVTFSIAVTSIYTASPLTGTLKVFDGTTLLGSPTLTNGQATLPISTLSAGPHSITAVYSGNTTFATATSTPLTETINAATTTITWPTPADIPYGTRLSATQLNATVSTAYATTVPGTFVYTPAAGTLLPAGPQTLSVTFTPTDAASFKPVTSTVTINVGKIAPVITWTAPADVIAGTTLSSTQLNATAAGVAGTLPGNFVYTPPAGTVLTAGTQTLSTTFTPTDLANYTTATASVPLNVIGLALTSLSTTTASLGQGPTAITLTGTGFANDAVVKVDGTAVTTTNVSRTTLTAVIPAAVFLTTHTIQVQVIDPALAQTSNTLPILMNTPPISVVFQGPTTVTPGQQPALTFNLNGTYPVPVTGTFTISFTPASGLPAGTDDPTIVFPNGKRTFDFTIPANSTITPPVVLQTGSIAGTITVTLSLAVNGQTLTPVPAVAPVVIAAPPSVPGITSVALTRNGNTLTVALFGYSNIRQVDHVTFHFIAGPGQDLKTTDITVDGATLFAPYFASPASIPVGGSFEYDQVFNLDQNAIVVGEVQVNLYNSLGQSLTGTAQ